MPFQIIRNDITKVKADAIVNTANPKPAVGRGTDRAIYSAAGADQLLAARKSIGNIAPGDAAYTDAFRLHAKYIIHTVGPAWFGGNRNEREILHSCYRNSLALADRLSCKSIAFPLIATGVYGFPKDEALQIALAEINKFLLGHEMNVTLVVFDRRAFELSGRLVGKIDEFIDEHSTQEIRQAEYGGSYHNSRQSEQLRRLESSEVLSSDIFSIKEKDDGDAAARPIEAPSVSSLPDVSGKSLDEILGNTGETFQQKLFELIDRSGMDDVTVYKKANIDRKVFSRIRCKPDYKPKKKTAVAFAIALELDMPTMIDLLSRAEIAFSPSSKFDLIISFFVTNKVYDIYKINAALFKYGQPILGD